MSRQASRNRKVAIRVTVLLGICLCLLGSVLPVWAAHDRVVALVVSSEAAPYRAAAESLRSILERDGIRNQTVALDRFIEDPDAAGEGAPIALWVAIGSRAASHLNTVLPESIPLVYCMVADPERIGLDMGRKNLVGVAVTLPVAEQFDIINRVLPELHRIGMLYSSSSAKSIQTLAAVMQHLPPTWQLEAVDTDGSESMAEAIQELFRRKVGLVWTMADSSVYNRATIKTLLLASLRSHVPVFGFSGSFVKAGALLGLEADPRMQGQYAASLVVEMLHRDHTRQAPKEIPGVTLAVNKIVAARLGISLPQDVMTQARIIGGRQ